MLYKFTQYSKINENVQAAKSLLLKLAAEDKKKKLKLPPEEKVQFSEEEERKIFQNPAFLELKDFFVSQKTPNLVYPFTYFMMVEGLPMTTPDSGGYSVENLKKKLDEVSPMLQTFPLPQGNNIETYIKNKKADDPTPAYEKLWDDIDLILSKKPIKEFVDNFVGPIRQEFTKSLSLQKDDPERAQLLDRLYHAVNDIKNLPPLVNPETGEEQTAERQIIRTASKYKDTRTYPEYADTFVAFRDFVRDCEDKVAGWESGDNEFIEELRSISPSIRILMYDPTSRIVVTSARSGQGMRAVCKIANATYCIRNDSTFWSYTSGKLQIAISQLALPKTDERYLTSFTVDPTGKVTDSANRSNKKVHSGGESYTAFLRRYGIGDQEIIDAIQGNFNSELTIKNLLEKIEKGKTDNKDIIFTLGNLSVQKAIENGEFTKEEMDTYKNLIIAIIKKDRNISYEDIISAFTNPNNGGFFAMEDIELFEALTDNKYAKDDVKAIWEITQSAIEYIQYLLSATEEGKTHKAAKYILDIHPQVAEYVQTKML